MVVPGIGFALFLLLGAAVELGLTGSMDLAAAGLESSAVRPFIDTLFPYVVVLWSPELSVLLGLLLTALLFRSGLKLRSLAGLAFLLAVPAEVLLKSNVHRPLLPPVLKSWPGYGIVSVSLGDTFVSGSAIRTAFFCVFLSALLWRRGGGTARAASVAVAVLTVAVGIFRIYGRYHWLSSELSGQVLGASLALLVALPVADYLETLTARGRSRLS